MVEIVEDLVIYQASGIPADLVAIMVLEIAVLVATAVDLVVIAVDLVAIADVVEEEEVAEEVVLPVEAVSIAANPATCLKNALILVRYAVDKNHNVKIVGTRTWQRPWRW